MGLVRYGELPTGPWQQLRQLVVAPALLEVAVVDAALPQRRERMYREFGTGYHLEPSLGEVAVAVATAAILREGPGIAPAVVANQVSAAPELGPTPQTVAVAVAAALEQHCRTMLQHSAAEQRVKVPVVVAAAAGLVE